MSFIIIPSFLILSLGFLTRFLFQKIKIPPLIGFLLLGILLGPSVLNFLPEDFLALSYPLRTAAFVILLLRAGLSLQKEMFQKWGGRIFALGLLPAFVEMMAVTLAFFFFFRFPLEECFLLGIILSAVSPAIVVKMMLEFLERVAPEKRSLPLLILSAASLDNVFVLTLFGSFLSFFQTEAGSFPLLIVNIPVSIGMGIVLGFLGAKLVLIGRGYFLIKTCLLFTFAFLFFYFESKLMLPLSYSPIILVLALGFFSRLNTAQNEKTIGDYLSKAWVVAEIFLFVLVGASLEITSIMQAGLLGFCVIIIGLLARVFGLRLGLLQSTFSQKEKNICLAATLPKATVQAVLCTIPLQLGLASGQIILAIAILAILITAPLGAFLIEKAEC